MSYNKIIIAGGSGFLGQIIAEHFCNSTKEIIVLSRKSAATKKNIHTVVWDGATLGPWTKELEDAEVIINLSGKSINCRHNDKNKKELLASRINATSILGSAIEQCAHPPKLWINASAAALYVPGTVPNTEADLQFGKGFMEEMCVRWENAFKSSICPDTRKITMRITLILGKSGGVFPVLRDLTKKGLGGKAGSGDQMISWMHETDFLNAIEWFIENEKAVGVYNMASPEPLSNKDFMSLLRKSINCKIGLPAPGFMIRLGAIFLQTEPSLILNSVNVIPEKLIENGFVFCFPTAVNAIEDLCRNR